MIAKQVLITSLVASVGLYATLAFPSTSAFALARTAPPALKSSGARTVQFAQHPYVIHGKTINVYIGPPLIGGGFGLATGLAGRLWYTLNSGHNSAIVSMTTKGVANVFPLPSNAFNPVGIVEGADHQHMWFTEDGGNYRYGSITASGSFQMDAIQGNPGTSLDTLGADKRVWFGVSGAQMAAVDASGNAMLYPLPSTGDIVNSVAPGPDGNIWYSNLRGAIGKITPGGLATEYNVGFNTFGIAAGANGDMWMTDDNTPEVAFITTGGNGFTTFTNGISGIPNQIVEGPDGNMYFSEFTSSGQGAVAKITTAGRVTEFALPYGFNPQSIVVGPDKNIWVDDENNDQLAQLILKK